MIELRVPSVTTDDLVAFHVRTYGKALTQSAPTSTLSVRDFQPIDGGEGEEEDDDDDELGYYDDGTKRTLTDDQIAIFRHSEVQSLLRERQRHIETNSQREDGQLKQRHELVEEVEKLAGTKELADDVENRVALVSSSPLAETLQHEEGGEDDEEEYVRFLMAEQKEMQSAAARSKKRKNPDASYDHNRKVSTRRLVRELDAAKSNGEDALDYGDEPQAKLKNFDSHYTELADGTKITYEEEPSKTTVNETKTELKVGIGLKEGRKIWWPTIQESKAT